MLVIKSCIPEQVEVTVTNQESKPSIHFPLGGDKLMVSRNEVIVENGLFVLASDSRDAPSLGQLSTWFYFIQI